MKTTSKKVKKIKTNSKKTKLFSIPLKFGGKPFLGLAQLSKIFSVYSLKANILFHWTTNYYIFLYTGIHLFDHVHSLLSFPIKENYRIDRKKFPFKGNLFL